MEILQTFTTLLLFSSLILLLIKAWIKETSVHENLPPSPPKLPVIGHLHHLVSELPHHALTKLAKKYGPVLHLQLGEVSAAVISSAQAAKEVMIVQDPACADRPHSIGTKIMWYDHADIAFSPYNEYWKQMRKMCVMELLSAKNVKSFGRIREDEVSRLVESLRVSSSCGEVVDLTSKVFHVTSLMTCRSVLGNVLKQSHYTLIEMVETGIRMAGSFQLANSFPSSKLVNLLNFNKYRLLRLSRKLDALMDEIVEEHRKLKEEEDDDEIDDVLLRMQRDRELDIPITNDNIKAITLNMFLGTETISHTIDCAMAELMRNPDVLAKAQREIRDAFKQGVEEERGLKYLKLVIKETLRLHPPLPLLPRACRDKCKVDGYTIPIKSTVLVNIWSLGRDPKYWNEPEVFRPERFEESSSTIDFMGNNFEYIPFGGGRRGCPGMNFGLAIVEQSLAQLLYHFDWQIPRGTSADDIDMTELGGATVRRKNALFLVPIYSSP